MTMSFNSNPSNDGRKVLTVSKLNQLARNILTTEIGLIWISAEISNFVAAASGHWYFTLKDSKAQVKAAMFRNTNRKVQSPPKEGDKVLVRASVSLYEPRGDYQVIIEHLQFDGEGMLKLEFEQCKKKLQALGLFDPKLKRPLPNTINTIGIITSAQGAALHDVLTVLNRRSPQTEVIVYPTLVQGNTAANQIIKAIDTANRRNEVDVLLLTRGGGSLEDLWCFNDEALAFTVSRSVLPIVSAVGHEIDFTISDFVADLRAPTPSAGAELLSNDVQDVLFKIQNIESRLVKNWQSVLTAIKHRFTLVEQKLHSFHPLNTLQHKEQTIDTLYLSLCHSMSKKLNETSTSLKEQKIKLNQQHPALKINQLKQSISNNTHTLTVNLARIMENKHKKLASFSHLLNSVSPLATLSRGYSITFNEHKSTSITTISQLNKEDTITTRLTDGEIVSKVIEIKKEIT